MDIQILIDELNSHSGDKKLTNISKASIIKKIHQFLPVPNDMEIKWAEMSSYGGYPSGIVLTDKGIFLKASHSLVKTLSKSESDKKKKTNIIYQYIPWDYYDPETFHIRSESKDENTIYEIIIENSKVSEFYDKSLYDFFDKLKKSYNAENVSDILSDASIASEMDVFGLDAAVFNAAYGIDNSNTGHGIYAENATSFLERLGGNQVSHTGGDNAKNGPDKIVNGYRVQCKYCKTAGSSVGNCFETDTQTGKKIYRYIGPDNKPMLLEVPKDQYDKAVEAMRKRIVNGEVPGVTDPNEASQIIRKGKLTYAQVRNLAKAGTIESLTYDAVTGVISCGAICGVSALVTFSITFWQTKDKKKAASVALETGLQVFGPSFVGMILASQIARTSIPRLLIPATSSFAKWLDPKIVQSIINAFRALLGKNPIYGAAAQNSFAKALRSTVLSQAIIFCATSIPDTIQVISKKISGSQYTKNMLSSVGSIAGGFGSSILAGKTFGKALEGKPIVAKVVGTGVAMVGGFISGTVVKKLLNLFREDDIIISTRMFNSVVTVMCIDYVLSEEELDTLIKMLDKDSKKMEKVLKGLYQAKHQYYEIERYLTPYFEQIVKRRQNVSLVEQQEMFATINEILSDTMPEGAIKE